MSKKPWLQPVINMLEKNSDFSLTVSQYEKLTGAPLPKDLYYLSRSSALLKECEKRSFKFALRDNMLIFEKTSDKTVQ